MKGLIYREFYLTRKTIALTLLVYFVFVAMLSLVFISTYAGNLRGEEGVIEAFYPQAYFYAAFIAILGMCYGHNDVIQKDYQSHWQLYSYTLPVSEKKIVASKFIMRGILLLSGLVLAVIAEVILSAAARMPISFPHIKVIFIICAFMTIGFSEIPLMLRFKSQNKAAIITLLACAPFIAAMFYFGYKFLKFCMAEATRIYGETTDETLAKIFEPYFEKVRDIGFIVAPLFAAGMLLLLFWWSVKELKRRRY
ncbi:ABC-2 transporter permease [Ruminococcus sp.]|uniref:ABC-2 transporter permease n=1 Tax=Ruminococcus sp. TaxID=41978 RepID=UPI0025FDDDA5|nr:ABC-2 transporter permease [Ruminococcus sp.]